MGEEVPVWLCLFRKLLPLVLALPMDPHGRQNTHGVTVATQSFVRCDASHSFITLLLLRPEAATWLCFKDSSFINSGGSGIWCVGLCLWPLCLLLNKRYHHISRCPEM